MKSFNLAVDVQPSQNHLDAIRAALRTQVSDILRANVSRLSDVPPHLVYDHVLDTPELLHECFQVFRSQPDLFKRVVIRPDKRPPTSDQDALWCGRSVDDVVRLVVRASAKRYFRATLPPPPVIEAPKVESIGVLRQTAIRLKLKKAPPPPRPPMAPPAPADELYGAYRSNLLYEWQVPLIPHYAPIDLPTVTRLGARMLDFREPSQLKILAEEGVSIDGRLPLVLDSAKRLIGPDGNVDPHVLKDAFVKLGLDAIFPDLAENGGRRAAALIGTMDLRIFQILLPALNHELKLTSVFLFTALSRMGEKAFRQGFGATGAIWAIQKLAKHLEGGCRPWPRSLPGLRQACERAIAFAIDLDSGLPAQNAVKQVTPAKSLAPAASPARASRAPTPMVSAPSRR